MQQHHTIEIDAINRVNNMVLQVQLTQRWSMEDSVELTDKLLQLTSATLIEQVQGADLYCVRLRYQDYELLLNFEEYSHSCWFECPTEQDLPGLVAIEQILLSLISR